MTHPPDLSRLSGARKDALIRELWAMVQERDALTADLCKRVAELEAKLGGPPKTPDHSSVPPSQGQKVNTAPGKARAGNKRGKGHGRGGHISGKWKDWVSSLTATAGLKKPQPRPAIRGGMLRARERPGSTRIDRSTNSRPPR